MNVDMVMKKYLTNIGKLGNIEISENLVKEDLMTNEEILKAAQNGQEDIGEYEREVVRKSLAYGAAFGVTIVTIMILVELFLIKKMDFGKPALLFAISGYADFYEGSKSRIRRKKVKGTIELIVAVFGILLYIGAFFV